MSYMFVCNRNVSDMHHLTWCISFKLFRNFVYDVITDQLKFTENVLVHACQIIKVIFFSWKQQCQWISIMYARTNLLNIFCVEQIKSPSLCLLLLLCLFVCLSVCLSLCLTVFKMNYAVLKYTYWTDWFVMFAYFIDTTGLQI